MSKNNKTPNFKEYPWAICTIKLKLFKSTVLAIPPEGLCQLKKEKKKKTHTHNLKVEHSVSFSRYTGDLSPGDSFWVSSEELFQKGEEESGYIQF